MYGCAAEVSARVARWFVFKPKLSIWVNFGEGLAIENLSTYIL
jgi:hypothetical protein